MTHHSTPATLRKHTEISIRSVRSLTPADLAVLSLPRAPIDIKRIRDRHRHVAFLCALGRPTTEIAAEVKMSPARVKELRIAPATQELIARYTAQIEDARLKAAADYGKLATSTMLDAERVISREMAKAAADPAAKVDLRTLNRIAADRMDRFGYGKHSTSESRNVNLNFAANLEAAIARARKVA